SGKSGYDVYGISLEAGANICKSSYWGGTGPRKDLEPAKIESPEPETTTTTAATTTTTAAEETETTAVQTTAAETTTEPQTTQPVDILWGDANCDKKVNMADAVAVLQNLANSSKYPLSAQGEKNADCDEVIGLTGQDAITIQKIDAGEYKQSDFPLK
ncbi:MAG: hypothetical protein IJ874_09365, partial [Ruminococcus sp.]|nr:hypothetical protein [Ruminococcus sp.]